MAADNLKYLEDKLAECNASATNLRSLRNNWMAEQDSLSKQLQAEKNYYSTLSPLNVSKKKASLSKQAAIQNKINEAKSKVSLYSGQLNSKLAECAKIQEQLDVYVAAVSEATANGLNASEQQEFANQATAEGVAAIQAADAAAQTEEESKKAKNMSLVVGGVILLIVLLILLAMWIKKKNAAKGAKAKAAA